MIYEKNKSIIENEVVLIFIENQPALFARVEKIVPDVKSGWWQVTFLILQIPLVTVTWILDNEQIRGADFTMKEIPIRIEKIVAPVLRDAKSTIPDEIISGQPTKANIISFPTKKDN